MIVRVKTVTGSIYAIDTLNRVAARLVGDPATESKNAADREWRSYLGVEGLAVGQRLFIAWTADKYRLTSAIIELDELDLPGEPTDDEILTYQPSHA